MEEERKEEGKKEEEIKKETGGIPGVGQAKEAMGMVQGIIAEIGSLIGGIFRGSKEEKKK